ncbi:MAG: carboxypeptidase regulatory-like domain-containing protein [Deltaproteobacteria bacterium]|nr:carboxypeptidase regulatory-like domain-containing protein [Deltaproteobacteria bacterium]MCL5792095.1 carboxypeptidase regulatory-like domain-containing protein [Deltaproteobacteria bacterium]
MNLKRVVQLASFLALAGVLSAGCSGSNGSTGPAGAAGTPGTPALSTGSISGTVLDSATQKPITGATVAINPAVAANVSTDTNGGFVFSNIPIGSYQAVISASGYNQFTSSIIPVVAGVTSTTQLIIVHGPYQAPLISGLLNKLNVGYASNVTLNANVTDPNNLPFTCQWTISSPLSTAPVLSGSTSCLSASFTTDTFAALASMNPSLVDPVGGLLVNRDAIVPISYNEMGSYTVTLSATNSKGIVSSSSVTVRASDKQTGIANVAVGVPVYLSFTEATPSFSFVRPAGSSAVTSTVAGGPYTIVTFTPDVAGKYGITETTYNNSFIIVAGTWVGVGAPVSGGYTNCVGCHNGTLTGNFAPWSQTPHASMFTNGINGVLGSHYGSSCEPCHTVGFDQATTANNNGFDDVAALYGWTFPHILQPSNWNNMVATAPTVSALANIQCENCHGPSNSLAHHSSSLSFDLQERVGWTAGVCNQCHDAPTHHVMGTQWEQSPHAQYDLAMNEGTIQNSPNAAHCGRCHSAQGFAAYLDQIAGYGYTGATNVLGFGGMTITALAGIGLTVSQVQPQTCQACHDPHDDSLPHQLRIYDTTILAAGFTVNSVGAGAVCMQCHNTRNGLHNDSTGISNYSAPHTPSQADILMGQNSYFTGITGTTTIFVSKHANIGDTCATCHMQLNPDNPNNAAYSHEFAISNADQGQLCANCHGSGVTGYGLQTEVQGLLNQLETNLSNTVIAAINFSASSGYTIWASNTKTIATPVTAAAFSEVHGQQGYQLWDSSNATFTLAIGSITATTGSAPGPVFWINSAANPLTTTVLEAGWNYALVDSEGSLGIHNPTYVLTILNNTLNQLP